MVLEATYILEWLKHFLTDQSKCIIINNGQNDPATVTSGIPQGTVLAPLLFLCYTNDLPNNMMMSYFIISLTFKKTVINSSKIYTH